jgi:hypothetical protein
MRALANEPTPTVMAVDLDGDRAVGRGRGEHADVAGLDAGFLEEVEHAGGELELFGDAATVNEWPTAMSDSGTIVGRVVQRAGDRVAVRAGGGVAEHTVHGRLDRVAHHVLPLAGLVVRIGPRQAEHVGEEPLGQAVAAHDALRQRLAGGGEAMARRW